MGDLLTAASLLASILTVLLSLWFRDLQQALGLQTSRHAADNGPQIRLARSVLMTRAVPLACLGVALSGVLLPAAVDVLAASWLAVSAGDATYDTLAATFVAVYVFILSLTVYALVVVVRLGRWMRSG